MGATRFQPGSCCGCSSTTTVCVTACTPSISLVGAVVTVGGHSCTTGSTGCCTISGLATGTYSYTVVYEGKTILSGSRSFTSGGTVTLNAGTPSGFVCCGDCLIPTTLYLTDSNGTWTMPYDTSSNRWSVCYSITVTGYTNSGSAGSCTVVGPGSITLYVFYRAACQSGSNGLNVTQEWTALCPTCPQGPCSGGLTGPYGYFESPNGCTFYESGPGGCYMCTGASTSNPFIDAIGDTIAWSSCNPFSLSGSLGGGSATTPPGGSSIAISS